MLSRLFTVFVVVLFNLAAPFGVSGAVNPPGLYFHRFTGAANGSEWSTWSKLAGVDRFEFADISGAGAYPATVTATGSITLDRGQGTGTFRDDGSASIDFTLGPGVRFHSEILRAAHTDDRFPAFLTQAIAGNTVVDGEWNAKVHRVDPESGATTLLQADRALSVKVSGTTVRISAADGWFVQAVWTASDQAAVRVVVPTPTNSKFRTFSGCQISQNQDCLGELRLQPDGSMTLALFYQSRDRLGAQVQSAEYIELSRVPAPGAAMPLLLAVLTAARRQRQRGR